jgi:energy-coupling factor transporter ATP-binding protein EcfA2
VAGRLAALPELGAGFHPEFTGRENIYFSGAVMGLSREEVRRQEESIIAFSELGDFIDEPVKTYSSGMYVRLGFAVATGFDFSVLLVDEALAVGDQRFQKKCTDRILDFRRQGKSILFCSHNLYHVRTLCDRAIWLHRGEARALGAARRVVDEYSAFVEVKSPSAERPEAPAGSASGRVCGIVSVSVQDLAGRRLPELRSGESFRLELVGRFSEEFMGRPALGASIVHGDGTVVYTVVSSMEGFDLDPVGDRRYRAYLVFEECPLLSGKYSVHAYATDQNHLKAYDIARDVASFTVVNDRLDQGLVRLRHRWESA